MRRGGRSRNVAQYGATSRDTRPAVHRASMENTVMAFRSTRGRAYALPILFLISFGLSIAAMPASAADPDAEIRRLRGEVEQLRRRDEENRARMAEMEKLLQRVLAAQQQQAGAPVAAAGTQSPASALDRALAGTSPAETPTTAASTSGDALDRALAGTSPAATPTTVARTADQGAGASTGLWSRPLGGSGGPIARLIDISLVTLIAGGGSTASDPEIGELEGGAHDPDQNGFTLQQAELSLSGAVDPYFTGEAHIVGTPGGFELEEAFLATTGLPFGLQVEAGYFLTEFGLLNPTHAHAWDWMDQPVVLSRFFGGDGLRSPGARVGWLLPLPFFSELHVGVQNADEGDLTASFMGGEGVGGRPNVAREVDSVGEMLWLGRWNASWDLSRTSALLTGASVLYGPNSTGNDGHTLIYGADVKYRWRSPSHFRGWPFVLWQAEVLHRDYTADWFLAGTDVGGGDGGHDHGHDHGGDEEEEEESFPNDLAADTLEDTGFYTQLLYGFRWGWAAGLRGEYVTGSGASIADGLPAPRSDDSTRDDRYRISPLIAWHPTEFSRLRLQYNYDNADFLTGGDAHTVWLGAEITYGEHAAHKY